MHLRVRARSTMRSNARHIWPDRVHAVEDAAGAEAVLRGLVALADPPRAFSTGTRTSS